MFLLTLLITDPPLGSNLKVKVELRRLFFLNQIFLNVIFIMITLIIIIIIIIIWFYYLLIYSFGFTKG
jgi:hypothetical protein